MSEERMIRVTVEEYKQWLKFVNNFTDELEEYDAPRQIWVFNDAKHLEPAPPKDWVPFCFNLLFRHKSDNGKCRGMSDSVECQQCPYRKRD